MNCQIRATIIEQKIGLIQRRYSSEFASFLREILWEDERNRPDFRILKARLAGEESDGGNVPTMESARNSENFTDIFLNDDEYNTSLRISEVPSEAGAMIRH